MGIDIWNIENFLRTEITHTFSKHCLHLKKRKLRVISNGL